MKNNRRRCHLRPRPTRSQIRQQVERLRRRIQLCQTEWILEAAHPDRNHVHLRLLHDYIENCKDGIENLEAYA